MFGFVMFVIGVSAILFLKYLNTSKGKGKLGEWLVGGFNSAMLDKEFYKKINNITLMMEDGSTAQIDHIVVSQYGIFVIETKNFAGSISGTAEDKKWVQKFGKKSFSFQNPILQNYRHLKSIQEKIPVKPELIRSVVVFTGDAVFKNKLPSGVFQGIGYIKYIKSFESNVLSKAKVEEIVELIKGDMLKRGRKTDAIHLENLSTRHNTKL